MPLPLSGPISFNAINVELGVAGTTQASLGQASYRALAGVPSGAISMSNFYGKANAFAGTISSNQQNLNLRTWALANGWNGSSAATITVNSGVYIWSDSSTPALTIDGSWPGGITLVNNGFIMGRGGNGKVVAETSPFIRAAATPGYNAIALGVSVTINNQSGYIGGGGGAGGSSGGDSSGGGGGAGGGVGSYSITYAPPAGGSVGQSGSSSGGDAIFPSGGGGGRILPGSTASGPTRTTGGFTSGAGGQGGGSGGVGIVDFKGSKSGGAGGGGGGWGASGGIGYGFGGTTNAISITGGSGGGSGAVGGNAIFSGVSAASSEAGTAGGKAINTNGNAVTWVGGSASSSRAYGAVS